MRNAEGLGSGEGGYEKSDEEEKVKKEQAFF